jgi:hypothetical protein
MFPLRLLRQMDYISMLKILFFIIPKSLNFNVSIPVISKSLSNALCNPRDICSQLQIRILSSIDTELLSALSVRIEYLTSTELGYFEDLNLVINIFTSYFSKLG